MSATHIVGAFSLHEATDEKVRSSQGRVLIDDEPLFVLGSSDEIDSLNEDGLFVSFVGDVIGYMVDIPAEQLARGPCQAMLHLYGKYGNDFAKHINGLFAIVLWDKAAGKLLLVQDKFAGIKTLYWSRDGNTLYFSNYIKPLLSVLPASARSINNSGLYQYLAYSRICAPDTIYEGIKQIPAGEWLEVTREGAAGHEYDPWEFPAERIKDKEEAIENYRRLLAQSMGTLHDINKPCGLLLSGGLDSGMNVLLQANQASEPVTTICVGVEEGNEDAHYARMLSKILGTEHHEYMVAGPEIEVLPQLAWQLENPHYEPGVVLVYCAMQKAKEVAGCVIGGEAADQVWGYASASAVYERYKLHKGSFGAMMFAQRLARLTCRNAITDGISFFSRLENKLFGKMDVNGFAGRFGLRDCDLKRVLRKNFRFSERYDNRAVPEADFREMLEFVQRTVVKDFALYGILLRNGRLADLLGIKSFSPYLDKNVFNYVYSLDTSLRTPLLDAAAGRFETKHVHKELARRLMPAEFIDRPKQGGAIHPAIHFQDRSRFEAAKQALRRSEFMSDLFEVEMLDGLLRGGSRAALWILLLLTLDLWHHIYIRSGSLSMPEFTLTDYLEGRV
jgi:asparagine synthase (glutamine-hydrolysing)